MEYFPIRYDSRVVNYYCRGFIRLTPGLVVVGWDSQSEGRGFKSQHPILVDIFFTLFVVNVLFVRKNTKINKKRAEDGPFLEKNTSIPKFGRKNPSSLRPSRRKSIVKEERLNKIRSIFAKKVFHNKNSAKNGAKISS